MPLRIETRPKPIVPSMPVTGPLHVLKITEHPTVWTSLERWCLCEHFKEFHPAAKKRRASKRAKKRRSKPLYSTMEYIA
jgi:hypothetical protein